MLRKPRILTRRRCAIASRSELKQDLNQAASCDLKDSGGDLVSMTFPLRVPPLLFDRASLVRYGYLSWSERTARSTFTFLKTHQSKFKRNRSRASDSDNRACKQVCGRSNTACPPLMNSHAEGFKIVDSPALTVSAVPSPARVRIDSVGVHRLVDRLYLFAKAKRFHGRSIVDFIEQSCAGLTFCDGNFFSRIFPLMPEWILAWNHGMPPHAVVMDF